MGPARVWEDVDAGTEGAPVAQPGAARARCEHEE